MLAALPAIIRAIASVIGLIWAGAFTWSVVQHGTIDKVVETGDDAAKFAAKVGKTEWGSALLLIGAIFLIRELL